MKEPKDVTAATPTIQWYVSDPEGFSTAEPFEFTIDYDGGVLSCVYDPNRMLIGLFNAIGGVFGATHEELQALADREGLSLQEVKQRRLELSREDVFALYEYARAQLFLQIKPKLEEALQELGNQLIVQALYDLGMADPGSSKADALNELDRSFRKQRNKRMGVTRGGSGAAFDLSELHQHYARLLPVWQSAKKIFRRNNTLPAWPEMVKASAGEELPPDLIARLADPPDISDELLSKLEKHGGGSSPADIALEHAARACGVTAYFYTLRHLQTLLAEQRENTEAQTSFLNFGKKGT